MSNLHEAKPKVKTITLNDGVEREIRFTLNAMAELEDRYGSVEAAFAALEQNSFKAVRCVLWAGLLHSDESLTEQQVGRMIDTTDLRRLMGDLTEAIGDDTPNEGDTGVIPNA